MALDPFPLQDPMDPEPVQPCFLDDDDGKDVPRPDACFLLELGQARSWDKRARRAAMSPLRTECFDIFSPLPGAREVMTQVDRLSSRDTKIALRSVRIAACSSGRGQRTCMGRSRVGGSAPSLCQRAGGANRAPMGSSKAATMRRR